MLSVNIIRPVPDSGDLTSIQTASVADALSFATTKILLPYGSSVLVPIKKLVPSHRNLFSASKVFALPEPVISLLSALLFIVVCVIPVRFAPLP